MKIVGHKTEFVCRRYSIVDHAMPILDAESLIRAQKRHVAELKRQDRLDAASVSLIH